MARYKDVKPGGQETSTKLWQRLTDLVIGNYSVEVLPDGDSIIYRVWFEEHCDVQQHGKL